jgi:hypothetical protein
MMAKDASHFGLNYQGEVPRMPGPNSICSPGRERRDMTAVAVR